MITGEQAMLNFHDWKIIFSSLELQKSQGEPIEDQHEPTTTVVSMVPDFDVIIRKLDTSTENLFEQLHNMNSLSNVHQMSRVFSDIILDAMKLVPGDSNLILSLIGHLFASAENNRDDAGEQRILVSQHPTQTNVKIYSLLHARQEKIIMVSVPWVDESIQPPPAAKSKIKNPINPLANLDIYQHNFQPIVEKLYSFGELHSFIIDPYASELPRHFKFVRDFLPINLNVRQKFGGIAYMARQVKVLKEHKLRVRESAEAFAVVPRLLHGRQDSVELPLNQIQSLAPFSRHEMPGRLGSPEQLAAFVDKLYMPFGKVPSVCFVHLSLRPDFRSSKKKKLSGVKNQLTSFHMRKNVY